MRMGAQRGARGRGGLSGLFPKKHMTFTTGTEPHVHADDVDSDDEDEVDYFEKKFYFMSVFGLAALAVLALLVAAAAPAWATLPASAPVRSTLPPHPRVVAAPAGCATANATCNGTYLINLLDQNVSARRNWRMFGECLCYQTTAEPCSVVRRLFLGGQITSLIACAAQTIVILLLAALYAGFFRRADRLAHVACCVCCYVACAALVITFATFSAAFDRVLCGEVVKRRGVLSWAFGLRVAEFALTVPLTVGMTIQAIKRTRRLAKTLLLAQLCILGFTVLTTTARGWVHSAAHGFELGLWEGCYCFETGCNAEVAFLQTMQAHVALTAIALLAFIVLFFLHIPKWTQLVALGFAFCTGCVVLGVFWAWLHTSFCDTPSVQVQGVVVQWPAYVPIFVVALTVIVFAIVSARACGCVTIA